MSEEMTFRESHFPPYRLEALRLGTLDAADAAAGERHLAGCAACRRLSETLQGFRQEFVREVLPRTRVAFEERAARTLGRGRRLATWWALLAVPAAAGLVLAVRPLLPSTTDTPFRGAVPAALEGGELAIKGGPTLALFARRGAKVFRPTPEARLAPGDQIRFIVNPAGYPFVMIASVDGARQASLYHPYQGTQSAAVAPGESVELPDTITLDDAPGPERIFALFSRKPLPADAVLRALGALGAEGPAAILGSTHLPVAGVDGQVSFLFEKTSAPERTVP